MLAQVRDPGNAGHGDPRADAAGADAVVLTESSVDVYNAEVRTCFRRLAVPPADRRRRGRSTPPLSGLRAAGLRVLAADGAGERDLDEEADAGGLDVPTAWVFGNEAWGLPGGRTGPRCDAVVRVPIHGRAESLNLATAAAVCLYASARAQRSGARSPTEAGHAGRNPFGAACPSGEDGYASRSTTRAESMQEDGP